MSTTIINILDQYPKQRPQLPKPYQDIYELHYTRNRQGATRATSISSRMERWLHRTVSSDLESITTDPVTLEIGAGSLNHLPYEPEVSTYDIIEPFSALLSLGEDHSRVRNQYLDIRDVPEQNRYDRIISIATFEHIADLPFVVASSALMLKAGGTLRVSIPNEGRLWWQLGTMVTGYEFKKMYVLDYRILMAHEHINTAREIEAILRHFFGNVKHRSFGINKSWSFYLFFECMEPKLDLARNYCNTFRNA